MMTTHTGLLLIEDNAGLREQMKWALNDEYMVLESDTLESAESMYREHTPAIVCLDMGLENKPERGLEIIDALMGIDRGAKIIVITSNTDATLGPRSVERGAFDYLQKPVEIDDLKVLLRRALRMRTLENPQIQESQGQFVTQAEFTMLGQSPAMKTIFEHIRRLARTDVSVLITGESGTGKELCARAVHHHSNRRERPFIPINCGAIPENLLESELFGYVRGAFTGANNDKIGLIEAAHTGTLFLDEIGDMPRPLQVKLLRFLEDQKLQRLGETKFRSLDVRVVAATNKNNLSDEGNDVLRTDLYYRLSEFEIHLPPLRDRGEDALLITRRIVENNRVKFDLPKLKISPRAEVQVLNYSWPGNVRELENKLNRASIVCQNQVIEPEDLRLSETAFSTLSFKDARAMFERNFILNSLKVAKGNVSSAAREAGISRPTFYDMMKKYGIELETETKIRS